MSPDFYFGILVTGLGLLWILSGNFGKNAVVVSGMVHYVYLFLWKGVGGLLGWTSDPIQAMIPIYISVAFIVFAACVPQMRREWMKPLNLES